VFLSWGFGVLGFWGFGVLGFWGFGVLGFWGFGVLGVLGFWGFMDLMFEIIKFSKIPFFLKGVLQNHFFFKGNNQLEVCSQ
jgi:hypothetical protein